MSTDTSRVGTMRPDVLERIRAAVEANTRDLEEANAAEKLNTVAWLTRNLLELAIWCQYCAESEEHSKEFVLDAAKDALDVINVPDGVFSSSFSFKTHRDEMLQKAEADGFKTFGDGYTRVSEAAKTLGKGEAFKHFNKLLSKFAHPTALTLIGNSGGYEMEL